MSEHWIRIGFFRGDELKSLFFWALMVISFSADDLQAETFNNDSIIALSSAGLGDPVLLSKINNLPCSYDVSTASIINLKRAGVSNDVITAMVDRCVGSVRAQGANSISSDPAVKRTPGLYINAAVTGAPTLKMIRPTSAGGVRVEGNGSILFPFTAKLSLPQSAAQTLASSSSPVFYFYFEAGDVKTGDFGTSVSAAAQSPSEFSLMRFKPSNGQRVMNIVKATPFSATTGIDPKNTIAFNMQEIGDGVFRVEMNSPLSAGQYAFVLRAGSGAYRIYDFEVR